MKTKVFLLAAALFATIVAGCGDHDEVVVTGPGFVGLDDSTDALAPRLFVAYTDVSTGSHNVEILSDAQSDGDIAFDPVLNGFTIASPVSVAFFGIDSFNPNLPEFRSFFTFPLDAIPATATIDSASVRFLVDEVSFASVVPAFLDMVEYTFQGLGTPDPSVDFNQTPILFSSLDFRWSDVGNYVQIDVTSFMDEAQFLQLLDLQLRFVIDPAALGALSRAPAAKAKRTVIPGPGVPGNTSSARAVSSARTTRALTAGEIAARHR